MIEYLANRTLRARNLLIVVGFVNSSRLDEIGSGFQTLIGISKRPTSVEGSNCWKIHNLKAQLWATALSARSCSLGLFSHLFVRYGSLSRLIISFNFPCRRHRYRLEWDAKLPSESLASERAASLVTNWRPVRMLCSINGRLSSSCRRNARKSSCKRIQTKPIQSKMNQHQRKMRTTH